MHQSGGKATIRTHKKKQRPTSKTCSLRLLSSASVGTLSFVPRAHAHVHTYVLSALPMENEIESGAAIYTVFGTGLSSWQATKKQELLLAT